MDSHFVKDLASFTQALYPLIKQRDLLFGGTPEDMPQELFGTLIFILPKVRGGNWNIYTRLGLTFGQLL